MSNSSHMNGLQALPDIDEVKEAFELLDDWEDRYAYIIELGKKLEPMPEELKTEASKVNGCVSQVWLVCDRREGDGGGLLHFTADSDAFIVKGLIAILFCIFQDKTAQEILNTNLEVVFKELNIEQHLSPNRRNGFVAMIERIKHEASLH